MNILYILQQSIYNNEKKWTTADSSVQMMRGILNELLIKTDWNFYILIAPIEDFADIKSYDEILKNDKVKFIEYKFPIDAFYLRQHFNIFDFDKIMNIIPKIDIIWNNIIEVSRNIKTWLFYKKHNAKLISCCYWMDCPEIKEEKVDKSISYQWRQFDGYQCSDICSFTCKSTYEAFINNAKYFINKKYIKEIKNKSTIWDFGYSKNELNKYKTNEKFNKKTILFLNRMSGINYTHHLEFIEAINNLSKKRNDFQVIFANPSNKISWDWLKNNVKNIYIYKEDILTREEYIKLLWMGDISVHLYNIERMGGCANVEAIYCDNITIMPKLFEYKRRGENKYPFYCDKNISVKSITKILDKVLNYSNFIESKEFLNIKNRNLESCFEFISDDVISDIKGIF